MGARRPPARYGHGGGSGGGAGHHALYRRGMAKTLFVVMAFQMISLPSCDALISCSEQFCRSFIMSVTPQCSAYTLPKCPRRLRRSSPSGPSLPGCKDARRSCARAIGGVLSAPRHRRCASSGSAIDRRRASGGRRALRDRQCASCVAEPQPERRRAMHARTRHLALALTDVRSAPGHIVHAHVVVDLFAVLQLLHLLSQSFDPLLQGKKRRARAHHRGALDTRSPTALGWVHMSKHPSEGRLSRDTTAVVSLVARPVSDHDTRPYSSLATYPGRLNALLDCGGLRHGVVRPPAGLECWQRAVQSR